MTEDLTALIERAARASIADAWRQIWLAREYIRQTRALIRAGKKLDPSEASPE